MKLLKIFILSDARSAHTIKWVNILLEKGFCIFLFSLSKYNERDFTNSDKLTLFSSNFSNGSFDNPVWSKLIFLKELPQIKRKIKEFKPDILHSHYASSYGLLGALTFFKPFIISVWGSDIYNFPHFSFLNKTVLKYNLSRADKILSTSKTMSIETAKYTNHNIEITPFGIDIDKFIPSSKMDENKCLVIGTVKTLEIKYGIDILIRAYHMFKKNNTEVKTNLLIVGGGSQMDYLVRLTNDLGINNETTFVNYIPYKDVPSYHTKIDIFVSVSREDSESFGVSVLESSSSGKPVIVSDVGGLPEVVKNNVTGLIVPKEDVKATALAIEKLVLDKYLREKLGRNGREHVINNYNLELCSSKMVSVYENILRLQT
jgi:glycosyltransferase involved in cell wall biosynthesis